MFALGVLQISHLLCSPRLGEQSAEMGSYGKIETLVCQQSLKL